jgi:hypothetical protein
MSQGLGIVVFHQVSSQGSGVVEFRCCDGTKVRGLRSSCPFRAAAGAGIPGGTLLPVP